MPQIETEEQIVEGVGGAIFVAFKDSNEDDVDPSLVLNKKYQWMRNDVSKTVINDKSFDKCSFSGNKIIISPDDAVYFGSRDNRERILSVYGTYTDEHLGPDTPTRNEYHIKLEPLAGVIDS